ncbi:hypothetical protein LCGC14_1577320 [marine sediment metagenome]|uniref:Periplasmic copper-binding protein NosD beta helix domain-containing protein n=1 Tax=marine sediment metagenome TaxID=412755 RepID=A0A0F9LI30_9ZZZZ
MHSFFGSKKKFLFCILALFLSNLFIFIINKINIIDNNILIEKNQEITFLKNSNFYNLTGSSIFIDDSDPDFNWSKTAAEKDWVSGSGTENDPYIIENVIIDAQNPFNNETDIDDFIDIETSTAGITIQNSIVYFIIRNSTIYNSEARVYDSGIKLMNVNNSQLINNTCSSNSIGILSIFNYTYYISSSNNVISNNSLKNNWVGIYSYSINNKISNNIIKNNFGGIISMGINNTISLNSLDNNGDGIMLFGRNNKISKNNLTHNINGLWLLDSFNNSIVENSINNNSGNGILLQSSNYNNISKNEVYNNKINGIHLGEGFYPYMGPFLGPSQDTNYNWISENKVYNNSNGILLNYTNNNHIINNTINNNEFSGIELIFSDYIDILNNTIEANYYGINMEESDWNDIIQNTINNNYYGISLNSSHWNDIIRNILRYNRDCYIENEYSARNKYEDNDCLEPKINEINWVVIITIISLIGLAVLLVVILGRKRTATNLPAA